MLALLEITLYHRFIFEPNYLIYWGTGGDSLAQSVPYFLSAADKFQAGDLSTWNFSQFLGAQFPQAFSPEYIASLFGAENVPAMMLVMQVAKSFLAGVFFYFYAFYITRRYAVRFAAGLGMALCGRMLALAPWTGYTIEVTFAAAMMWGFERFLADRSKFAVLPIAFAGMIASMNVYCLILYSFFMLVYVTARIGYGGHGLSGFGPTCFFCLQLLGLYFLGIMLSAIIFLPLLECYLGSARISSTMLDTAVFTAVSSPQILASQYLSMFSPYSFGSAFDYSGLTNGLNQCYYYCGVFLVLAAPFAFIGKTARQRVWLSFVVALILLYVFSQGFRYALNGFNLGADDFRASSFWITLLLAYLGVLGLDALFKKPPVRIVVAVAAIELVLYAAAFLILRDYVVLRACAMAIAALIAYVALFCMPSFKGPTLAIGFIIVAVLELFAQGYPMVNYVLTNTQQDYDALFENGFEGELDVVDGDDNGLYRLAYPTQLFTRGLASNFKGTQAYIGGTGISKELTDFLRSVYPNDYVERMGYSRYAYGFNDPAMNTLLSVRYLATDAGKQELEPLFGFERVEDADNPSRIYENKLWLPAITSYSYAEAVSNTELLALPRNERGPALLASCSVPNDMQHMGNAAALFSGKGRLTGSSDGAIEFDDPANYRLLGAEGASFPIEKSEAGHLLVSMRLEGPAQEAGYVNIRVSLSSEDGHRMATSYLTASGNEDICIAVENEAWNRVTIDIPYSNASYGATISGFEVHEAPASYFDAYLAAVEDKLAEGPTITEMSNSSVKGSLVMAEDGYIATSVPWSSNWHAFLDGEEVSPFLVNFGFIGLEAQAGYHEVELRYVDNGQIVGAALALVAIFIMLGAAFALRRKKG